MDLNYIKDFIQLQDKNLNVLYYYRKNNDLYVHISTIPRFCECPSCKEKTRKIYDYREQTIQHLTINSSVIYLVLHKRRYECPYCGKKFLEKYSFINRMYRKSNILINKVKSECMQLKNNSTIAIDNNISSTTVNRYNLMNIINYSYDKEKILPKRIGFDEFKGNVNSKKYICQITNLDTGFVVDVLESKDIRYLEQYFHSVKNRREIEIVSIDMCLSFKRIIKREMPQATIVIDRFHYTRTAIKGLDDLRINLEKEVNSLDRKLLKHSKRLLMARYDNLSFAQSTRLHNLLKISKKLETAYNLKEQFLKINIENNFDVREKLFKDWLKKVVDINIKEFLPHVKALNDWHKYITNSFKYSDISNGKVEGKNNKIKVIKRMAFGYRNFTNFRCKILVVCGNIA